MIIILFSGLGAQAATGSYSYWEGRPDRTLTVKNHPCSKNKTCLRWKKVGVPFRFSTAEASLEMCETFAKKQVYRDRDGKKMKVAKRCFPTERSWNPQSGFSD